MSAKLDILNRQTLHGCKIFSAVPSLFLFLYMVERKSYRHGRINVHTLWKVTSSAILLLLLAYVYLQKFIFLNKCLNSLKKCLFEVLYSNFTVPFSPPGAKSAPPQAEKIRTPPAGPFFTPLLPPTTVPKYEWRR